jgi:GDPmannose 4,6-dehydratase|tara:strand:- start:3212 stop:4252 length:1041 start_codon:yes stop_codon:yes gene_type:complete
MKALISGITGQDGSYLAEYLLSKGYEVHGLIRRASTFNTSRLDNIFVDPHIENAKLLLHYGDLADSQTLSDVVYNLKPDEVYHLGAQSHVRISFDIPEYTANITALGTIRILDVIRRSGNKIKFYQASSSEMFGDTPPPQNENTPFKPRSPYAAAKVFAYWLTEMYRNGYGVLSCNGILFNHESPRRGETFVTRKITMAIANILAKNQDVLYLGNLEAKRDWGYAPEYVEMMWKMLKKKKYENFVVGTGESHSVREFLNEAFAYTDLKYDKYVKIDPKYFRPTDTEHLVADNKKVQTALNWTPKISFKELVRIMVDADMRKTGINPIGEGDEILKKKFPNKWWKGD